MSSRPLRLIAQNSATAGGKMYQAKGFAPAGGRGRSAGAGRSGPRAELSRDGFLRWWSGLMLRKLGSARAIARRFDVTEQTGRNWVDGFSCPTGLQVMRAQGWWPEEFALAAPRMRRAA